MWRQNPVCKLVGIALIVVGSLILFARVLPAAFWWFCVGGAMVALGVWLLIRH